ncbi:hypothetical protein [Oligoflexus tunisiensis]|uniref:hypothetical protein n=1 Tax=Oligoflexus tunisiensis TaxID=708132 RepID=UPI00114D0E02|nr:hypothetical protein [Oligoflexus tunisiensis]
MHTWLLILLLLSGSAWAKDNDAFIDYDKLDLTVTVKALRAGNQDPSGLNSYYFRLTADALPILKEEVKKPFAERLKVERVVGEFAQIEIKSLKNWTPDKKPNPLFSLALKGDLIREIAAETMRQFKVAEEGVSIICRVEMFERSKKFGFWGDDLLVGEATFPIIPETLPHGPRAENRELKIEDDSGTLVRVAVVFKYAEKKPVATKTAADASAAAPK